MTTATNETRTGRRTAPARGVHVSGRAELRPAMRAARTVMSLKAVGTHAEPTCRLVAREAQRDLEVLATNGEVALRTYIDSWPQGTSRRLDVAIDKALVRELAETKAEMIAIEQAPGGLRLSVDDEPPQHRTAADKAIDTATLDRILKTNEAGATALGIGRHNALRALRAMPREPGPVCRLRIGPEGLDAWATTCEAIGPDYEPEARLASTTRQCKEAIVIGVSRKALTAMLGALHGRALCVTIESYNKPIQLRTNDGRQTAVIAAKRLG